MDPRHKITRLDLLRLPILVCGILVGVGAGFIYKERLFEFLREEREQMRRDNPNYDEDMKDRFDKLSKMH